MIGLSELVNKSKDSLKDLVVSARMGSNLMLDGIDVVAWKNTKT